MFFFFLSFLWDGDFVLYIVFEGVDGVGKSTQIGLVKECLESVFQEEGYDVSVFVIAEPELVDVVDFEDDVELTLRFALQRRLLHKKYPSKIFCRTVPTIVLSDRSYFSSLAYQSSVGVCDNYVGLVNSFVHRPAMIFFFDAGVCEDGSLERVREKYFDVLPFNAIYVDTENHPVGETTQFIVRQIIGKWKELFENKDNLWRFQLNGSIE